jgi:ketosteroid isomerase-like protein
LRWSVRDAFEASNRGDWEALTINHDERADIYPVFPERGPGLDIAGHYRGRTGYAQFQQEWSSSWDRWETAAEEIVDAGTCVLLLYRGRGEQRGMQFERECATLLTFDRGSVVREDNYLDRDTALRELDFANPSPPERR